MDELRYPAAFSPFEIILFNTIKHKESQIVITSLDAVHSLSYVGTYDGKLLLYEYRIVDVNLIHINSFLLFHFILIKLIKRDYFNVNYEKECN